MLKDEIQKQPKQKSPKHLLFGRDIDALHYYCLSMREQKTQVLYAVILVCDPS